MKTCTLCGQQIKDGDSVVAILGATYVKKDEAGNYDLTVSRQAILSHFQCATPSGELPSVPEA